MRTVSDSFRWVTIRLWPGARRSRSGWMSASESSRREGHPSTTAPIAAPCDSPQVVTRNSLPNVFPIVPHYNGRTMSREYDVAILGATGLVGRTMARVLEERKFPVRSIKLLASARSVGTRLPFMGEEIPVVEA